MAAVENRFRPTMSRHRQFATPQTFRGRGNLADWPEKVGFGFGSLYHSQSPNNSPIPHGFPQAQSLRDVRPKAGKRKQPSPSNCSPNVHCSPKLGSSSKNPQVLTTAISMPWRRPCCGRFCGSLAFQKGPQLCHGSLGPSCVTTDIAKPTRTSHLGPGAVSQLFADRPALGT